MRRKSSKKGFTLAEVLIVVAIIAVLVAVSIPVFTSKLERAREATDVANMRAAKAAAVTQYLDDATKVGDAYYYDADRGVLKSGAGTIQPYGKGTKVNGGGITYAGYDPTKDYTDKMINVQIADDGQITLVWD